jgi:hypothetical protein
MHVLIDDRGGLTLRRLQPWHRMLARVRAPRLDRELAGGTPPEANAMLAARAMQLTSMTIRRGLATSLQRMLPAAAARPDAQLMPGTAHRPRVPVQRERIGRSAPALAAVAGRLVQPGPVPVRGVAIVSQLLADGGGPLYRAGSRDDLDVIIGDAARLLTPRPA